MGSGEDDPDAQEDEKPQHRVYLDEYWIGKTPVTVVQFAAYIKVSGAKTNAPLELREKADHPISEVTWDEAVAFCGWARRVIGREMRLPTEAEWEKATRGGDGRIYPWGNKPPDRYHTNIESWFRDTTPVGKFSPLGDSPYGCADMAGNVWEWCADWYDEKYYSGSLGRNPAGPSSGEFRVIRGGSCFEHLRWARCAARLWGGPAHWADPIGFRVVVGSPSTPDR